MNAVVEAAGAGKGFAFEKPEDILSLTDSTLIKTDVNGVITSVTPQPNNFGIDDSFRGANISRIYANSSLHQKLQNMLCSRNAIDAYKKLAADEMGILGVHYASDDTVKYDAVIRNNGLKIARIAEKALKGGDGEITGFSHILTNVTESHSLKQTLEVTEKRLHEICKSINDIVYIRDLEGNVTYVSPSVERITGYPAEKMTKPLTEWPIGFSGAPDFSKTNRLICNIPAGDNLAKTFELDETRIQDDKGCVRSIRGVLKHVTELVEARKSLGETQERFNTLSKMTETLIGSIPYGIGIVDSGLNILLANKSFDEGCVKEMGDEIKKVFETSKELKVAGTTETPHTIRLLPSGQHAIVILENPAHVTAEAGEKQRTRLSSNEKRVLTGLIANPDLNNRELSRRIGVNMSTLTSIKNKFLKKRLLKTCVIINPRCLGCTILSLINYKVVANRSDKTHPRIEGLIPEAIYHLATKDEGYVLLLSKDLRDFEDNKHKLMDACKSQKMTIAAEECHFPLNASNISRLFNYSHALKQEFGLNNTNPQPREINYKADDKLTRKEREVIKGIVNNPDLKDVKLAEKIKVSRPTLTGRKKDLKRRGVFRKIAIPRPLLHGQEFVVINVLNLQGNATKALKSASNVYSRAHVLVESETDGLMMSLARDYSQIKSGMGDMMEKNGGGAGANALRGAGNRIHIIPTKDIVFESLDFRHIAEKVFG